MRLSYDATTDVAYLSLRAVLPGELLGPTLLVEPDCEFPGAAALDFSRADGRVVGLEFQMASACLPSSSRRPSEATARACLPASTSASPEASPRTSGQRVAAGTGVAAIYRTDRRRVMSTPAGPHDGARRRSAGLRERPASWPGPVMPTREPNASHARTPGGLP